jgi:lysozyme family protein
MADKINNQSIAEFLVDWLYNSGSWGIKIPQRILQVKEDGLVGEKTILAVNNANGALFFCNLIQAREKFFRDIVVNNPSQKIFLKGWINRNNSFTYKTN